jgi:hypothetical protein
MAAAANSLVSGGRPEGSKCNLNFQGGMWHHLKLDEDLQKSLCTFFGLVKIVECPA